MKRFHLHIRVDNLAENITFYSTLFSSQPTVVRDDYAKWMLDDPQLNFALSTHGDQTGISHVGIEFDEQQAFEAMIHTKSKSFTTEQAPQMDAQCCYAQSDKYWLLDPQNVPWEFFHTFDKLDEYGISDTKETIMQGNNCCG